MVMAWTRPAACAARRYATGRRRCSTPGCTRRRWPHEVRLPVASGLEERRRTGVSVQRHQQLGAPIIVVWDKLPWASLRPYAPAHRRTILAARVLPARLRPGTTVNPAEDVWSSLRRAVGNLTADTVTDLVAAAKTRLKRMQYHPSLVDRFLAATGLSPPRP